MTLILHVSSFIAASTNARGIYSFVFISGQEAARFTNTPPPDDQRPGLPRHMSSGDTMPPRRLDVIFKELTRFPDCCAISMFLDARRARRWEF